MTELKLFNSETREEETIQALNKEKLTFYTCGPTIYNYAHIGNFRTYVALDLLKRALCYFGFKVHHVMNLTDVDDKTIKGANQKKITLKAFTDPYKEAFLEDLTTLKIVPADNYPEATAYIPQMITMIGQLQELGFAYKSEEDGSIYFKISAFKKYGRLSHLDLAELKSGLKNLRDEYGKDHIADFVLWKAYDPERDGPIYWESPFGKGRPGWHIECSVMASALLGETIDIHAGGVDLAFPHHENEIAQSECCHHGTLFVRHWVHVEHLLVDERKMSKSANNFYILRDLLKMGYTGREVRYMLMQVHYRKQLNFTFEEMKATRASLARLDSFEDRLKRLTASGVEGEKVSELSERLEKQFKLALADDLNVAVALSVLFELVLEGNKLCDQNKIGSQGAKELLGLLQQFDTVFGILDEGQKQIPQEVQKLLAQRQKARAAKDFTESDRCRDQLLQKGYLIEDLKDGTARLSRASSFAP